MSLACSSRVSDRLRRACAAFGLGVRFGPRVPSPVLADARALAEEIDARLREGEIALVSGPSGCGKSTVLRELRRRCACVVAKPPDIEQPVADLFRGGLDSMLRALAAAGLADATVLPRLPRELSEGERFRLTVALALERASRRAGLATLVVDEFATSLDRPTARGVARTLRRWVNRAHDAGTARLRVVVATPHDDLVADLAPDLLARPLVCRAMRASKAAGGG